MRTIGVVVAALGIVACSSDSDDKGSACPDITGNYSATASRESGSCDPSLDPTGATTVTVSKSADGAHQVAVPGVSGTCPATVDAACKMVATCELKDTTGAVAGTVSIAYTFTTTGYTGTSVTGIRPPLVATTCEVTYRERATKL